PPEAIAEREARGRARLVEYVVSCCADWQVDQLLTDEEKVIHAERIARRMSFNVSPDTQAASATVGVTTAGTPLTKAEAQPLDALPTCGDDDDHRDLSSPWDATS